MCRGPVKACILVRVKPGSEGETTEAVEQLNVVEDAFAVLGQPEVVVRVDAPQLESLGGIVAEISRLDEVLVSETLLEIPEGAIG